MTIKRIKDRLKRVLLKNDPMDQTLYQSQLFSGIDYLKSSMRNDSDDYIFSVIVEDDNVAMLLIEKSGQVYVNENARAKLRELWPSPAYEKNMQVFIPDFAQQLVRNEIPINGVKTMPSVTR